MLRTECILTPRQELEKDVRISVMSRHTLSDGVTQDTRITSDLFDEHVPELAPPLELVGDYYKRGMSWEEYADRYNSYLRTIGGVVLRLAQRSCEGDITLLCIEHSPEHCHRRLLAERCKELIPNLEIEIN